MPQHFVPFLRRFPRWNHVEAGNEWSDPHAVELLPCLLCLMLFFLKQVPNLLPQNDAESWYFSNARRPTTPRKQLQTSGDGFIFRLPGCHEKDQQKHEVILIWGWALYSFNTKDPAQKSHPSHLKLSQILWAPSGTLNIWLRSFTPSNKQKHRTNSVLPNYPRHDT